MIFHQASPQSDCRGCNIVWGSTLWEWDIHTPAQIVDALFECILRKWIAMGASMYERYSPEVDRYHGEWGPSDSLVFYWLRAWTVDRGMFIARTFPLGRPWHHLRVRTWRWTERVGDFFADIDDALASIFWP